MRLSPTLAARFASRINMRGPDECWPWSGKHSTLHGYGVIYIGKGDNGKPVMMVAHRVAYMLAVGPIPGRLCVLHRCDNPPCCNPAHLFLGTRLENHKDMMAKGRQSKPPLLAGEDNPKSKLTEMDVRHIRMARNWGVSTGCLARRYCVRLNTIRAVLIGRTWRRV